MWLAKLLLKKKIHTKLGQLLAYGYCLQVDAVQSLYLFGQSFSIIFSLKYDINKSQF